MDHAERAIRELVSGQKMVKDGYAMTIGRKEHGRWKLARDANVVV